MESCYRYSLKTFDKGIFDRGADATYVIHLEGNGRYDGVMKQLEKYHPTKLVYIAFNKGYKNCKKNLKTDLPRYDLIDAFLKVFKHAMAKGYNNILVLEDDFIFNELVLDPVVSGRVNNFIEKRGDASFIYLLGCLTTLQAPFDMYHNLILISGGTHSVIYSKKFIEETLKKDQSTFDDWDQYTASHLARYSYYTTLCYQTFPLTENKKNWNDPAFKLYLIEMEHKLLGLDTKPEPGYTIHNIYSKLLFYLYLIIVIYIIYFIIKYFSYFKKIFYLYKKQVFKSK